MKRILILFAAILAVAAALPAQTASLRGQVTDQSGASVAAATITVLGPAGPVGKAVSTQSGAYVIAELPLGTFTVQAVAPNLTLQEPVVVTLAAGRQTLNLTLYVATDTQQVTVEDTATTINTDTASNASAVSLRGKDLDALSDNPDDLAADLAALAGPAAGPNGGSIYIDGFSGGELPPKNAIREIRINQNPFSPEYDKLGYGRIEIFTKPGTDKYRGSVAYNYANDHLNSRNPYAAAKAPFLLNESRNSFSGPLGKRASFTLDFTREWVDNGMAINGIILDPATLQAAPYTAINLASLSRFVITPRVDYQMTDKHTASLRYSYRSDVVDNAGTGSLNLASLGYHNDSKVQNFQITETAMLSPTAVTETRFQYNRADSQSQANNSGPTIRVLGSFNGGANAIGNSGDTLDSYELQNYTSLLHKTHSIKFGTRLRIAQDNNTARQNFNGSYTFSGVQAPTLDAANKPILDAAGNQILIGISSIESYRRTLLFQSLGYTASQVRALGGGASQFTLVAGTPALSVGQVDLGAFVSDDWKIRPSLTLAFGLRYETQNNIHDWADFAPRIGLAWAPSFHGKANNSTVIRAGFGVFYDRFALGNTLNAQRYNGSTQLQYIVSNPDFYPSIPAPSALSGLGSVSVQKVSSDLRAPYLIQSAIALEHQLPHKTTLAITFANSHGLHQLRSVDSNAPKPGTYDPDVPGSGVYPLGVSGHVYVMQSSGLYNQNQLIVNLNSKINSRISLNGTYTWNRALSNTDGVNTMPANPYSMAGEYGPAATDIHHFISLTGTITPFWGINLNPMLTANSGPPFDLTTGRDIYGAGVFNARPGIATDKTRPGVVATKYGLLDPDPTSSETIVSRNFGRGPGQVMLNSRIGKSFGFGLRRSSVAIGGDPGGPLGGGGGGANPFSTASGGGASAARHYTLNVSAQIRNLLNHNNPGPITGNITSPLFGKANQSAGEGNGIFNESANNRRVELQMRFTF